jgi:hypothetical protein
MRTNYLPSLAAFLSGFVLAWAVPANSQTNSGYQIFVSNEKSGELSVISGGILTVGLAEMRR